MQHLDEGTIHAWLDGALDTTRSREIEAHVAQCPACSAAVAEARGFVAASSRILTALDDVPGGVVPKRVASPPVKVVRRQWRAAPWVSGLAAAALLFAVGVQTVNKSAQVSVKDEAAAPLMSLQTDTAAVRVVDSLTRSPTLGSATPIATSAGSAPAQPPSVASRRDRAANQARTETLPTDAAAVSTLPAGAGEGAKVVAAAPAEAPQLLKDDVASVKKSAPATPEQFAAAAAADMREKSPGEDTVIARLAGCYRIEPEFRLRRAEVVAGGVAGGAARGRAAAPAPAAAADRSAQSYATAGASAIVRLDTTRHQLGFGAREVRSDTLVGAWRKVGQDSARVDMLAGGVFTFALKNRVTCPDR
jgi:hypothetical protein